ncbi:hypothetical protein RI129_002786 [Pyrocoelia pectoralis]|uniref:Winged helix-turn helix domain-containing protein n=1 Tax=Pyrocoelia pectoralis TaxID=417401 RepID=A0AAN7VPJ6_9COLE
MYHTLWFNCDFILTLRLAEKILSTNLYLPSITFKLNFIYKWTFTNCRMLWNIIKEIESSGTARSPKKTRTRQSQYTRLQDFEKSRIRKHVHSFFFKNELPTLEKVLRAINDDDSLPDFKRTSLWRVLRKLGFKYQNRSRKTILIEKKEIVLWRRKYLTSIKKHVKNKIWNDTTVTTARQAHLQGLSSGINDPSGKGKRLIVVHMGSNSGFVEGA